MDTGTESSESCAQVLTALCSLGIDPQSDSRFIKNGNTVLDNLMSFRQEDGGFVHAYVYDASNPASIPDESDFLAGGQAAYALTAFCRYKNNMKNLFNLRPEKASLLSKNGSAMPVMVIAVVIAVIAAAVVLMLKIRHRRSMGCHDSKNRIQVCKNTVGKKILTDFAESKQYKYNRTVMRKRGHMRKTEAMINEIEKVIIGKREVIEQVLMTILAKGHVLLEDIPGVGKTTLALSFAKVMGVDYHRIQFTPDVTPSDVVGFSLYDRQSGEFQYKPGAVMCNLLLADEINRTSPKTQSALLEVMEEGNVTVDGITR